MKSNTSHPQKSPNLYNAFTIFGIDTAGIGFTATRYDTEASLESWSLYYTWKQIADHMGQKPNKLGFIHLRGDGSYTTIEHELFLRAVKWLKQLRPDLVPRDKS